MCTKYSLPSLRFQLFFFSYVSDNIPSIVGGSGDENEKPFH